MTKNKSPQRDKNIREPQKAVTKTKKWQQRHIIQLQRGKKQETKRQKNPDKIHHKDTKKSQKQP